MHIELRNKSVVIGSKNNQITSNEYVIETPEEVTYLFSSYQLERGAKRYEWANHLGNVLTVILDRKTAIFTGSTFSYFSAERISATDYSPFGAPLASRTWNGGEYRFGFNGKENDNEIKGFANIIDFGERILDSRLGKFLTIDPLYRKFPMFSPFQFASNSPVAHIDLDGLEGILAIFKGDFKGFWQGWKNYRDRNSSTGLRGSKPEQMPSLIPPPVNSTFTFGSNIIQFGNGIGFAQISKENQRAIDLVVGTLLTDPSSIITIQGTSNINLNNANARASSALSAVLTHPNINSGLNNQNQIQSQGGVIIDNNNNPVLDNFGTPILANRIVIVPSLVGQNQPLSANLTAIPATPIPPPILPKRNSAFVEFFKYVFGNVNVKNGYAKNRGEQSDVNK
ncbi:MAG: RHS repeat domain-containing protein [Bacteroidia bacterium]